MQKNNNCTYTHIQLLLPSSKNLVQVKNILNLQNTFLQWALKDQSKLAKLCVCVCVFFSQSTNLYTEVDERKNIEREK